MTGAASTHELRKYSENGQLPLAPAACEPHYGWDPARARDSPLCAALTAFTELVVARLGVFAAFASLTDGCTQRVLAGTWGQTDGDGWSWLAGKEQDHHAWLSLARRTHGLDHDASDRLFPDGGVAVLLDRDPRAADLSCVVGPPHVKYYAAVPIRTRRRICIGTLFILDQVTRPDSFDADLTFLSSVAAKCMTQLETARESHLKSRITRISDGVCSFIHSRSVGPHESSHAAPSKSNPASGHTATTVDPTKHSHPPASKNGTTNETQATKVVSQADIGDGPAAGTGRTTYKEAFARAALHLRTALDVDGVLFVDGLIGFHGALTPLAKREQELEDEMNQKSRRKDQSKGEQHWTPPPENTAVHSPIQAPLSDDASGPAERTFSSADYQKSTLVRRPGEILAANVFSPTAKPRIKNLSVSAPDENYIDERFLRRFLARYPSGKIWYFDDDGAPYTFSDGESLVSDDPSGEAKQLSSVFPGIRQLIFAPLTDPVTLKRLAGCYAWTSRVHPVFTEAADLKPFRGFLHSVEAEVSRIDTVAAIKQQESFVSSVSHELRTPLHGILGAVEFLGETKLDSFQQGLAESIRSCGSTLHDTLSSVLSYSKINQFERRRHKSKHRIPESPWALANKDALEEPEHDLHGLLASANIATLCEEVVEVTAGGHSFVTATSTDDLTITLDVKSQDNWNFMTEPGALRRIMTNILGNALKYTEKGFVRVGLDTEDISTEPASTVKPGASLKLIVFTVADSGKGMSKEFLEKHLSVPFTQEDTMASQGVGLGMSIVKSLVAMLGGKIRVKSQLGKGSTFTVSIPMASGDAKTPSPATLALEKAVPEIRQRALNVSIRGFPPLLQDSFRGYLRDWFNCNVLSLDDNTPPDVLVVDQADRTISHDVRARYQKHHLALLNVSISPSLRRRSDSLDWGFRSRQTISRPIGPHKLSKALLACAESLTDEQSDQESPRPVTRRIDTSATMTSTHMEVDSTVSPRSKALARAADTAQNLEDMPSPPKRARHLGPDGSSPHDQPAYPFRAPSPYQHIPHDSHQSPISPTAPAAALALEQSLLSLGSPVQAERTPRLLLVEDNAVNLKLLQTFMLKKGYTDAATAENGKVAVEEVAKSMEAGGGFDIIFMDISMPIMDGFEATRAIRALEKRQRITTPQPPHQQLPASQPPHNNNISTPSDSDPTTPYTPDQPNEKPHPPPHPQAFVVALTGLASRKDEDKAYRSGIDLVITKPVKFGKLTELFEKWEKGELRGGGGGAGGGGGRAVDDDDVDEDDEDDDDESEEEMGMD